MKQISMTALVLMLALLMLATGGVVSRHFRSSSQSLSQSFESIEQSKSNEEHKQAGWKVDVPGFEVNEEDTENSESSEYVEAAGKVNSIDQSKFDIRDSQSVEIDDNRIKKRSPDIPDVGRKESHEEHDEYLNYKAKQTRFRRADDTSEEDSSEEKPSKGADGTPAGKDAADITRRKRHVDGDNTSEEDSSEEKSPKGADRVTAGKDDTRRRRHVDGDNTSEENSSEEKHKHEHQGAA